MAAAVADLQSEVSCPVCLEYFTDPVTIECGHSYCRACITLSWDRGGGALVCPQCRKECTKTDLAKNLHLANLVEIVQRLPSQRGVQDMCERHNEPLKLFCQEDQRAVCLICDRSKDHCGHTVLPIEEAVEQYQLEFIVKLDCLQKEMNNILSLAENKKHKLAEFQGKVEKERMRIESEFKELYQFLEAEKVQLLQQLVQEETSISQRLNEVVTRCSEQRESLSSMIAQIEERTNLSWVQQLRDVKSFLKSCEHKSIMATDDVTAELSSNICSFSKEHVARKMSEKYTGSPGLKKVDDPRETLIFHKPSRFKMPIQGSPGLKKSEEDDSKEAFTFHRPSRFKMPIQGSPGLKKSEEDDSKEAFTFHRPSRFKMPIQGSPGLKKSEEDDSKEAFTFHKPSRFKMPIQGSPGLKKSEEDDSKEAFTFHKPSRFKMPIQGSPGLKKSEEDDSKEAFTFHKPSRFKMPIQDFHAIMYPR
ncbi:E3 ubiquitin-protein ligase TRIM39-like isoform X2 [Ambystoma mexicanum]|uniref:E3 ubiquitin-protein ligase TRIM39-like isoform X2 n=1 Tax=Ambystoma mexicanum TaxID=8296 RepID=UPI0037E701B8